MTELQSHDTTPPSSSALPIVGERRHFYFNDAGQPAYRVTDLTAEDFLNPLPDDGFHHGTIHDESARILASMLHHHYRYSPTVSVHIRPKMIWADAALAQPMPDVIVINNLSDQHRHRPVLDLVAEQNVAGVQGDLTLNAIFEVTSPLLVESDLAAKHDIYAQAGVPEYWIIDTGLRPQVETPAFTIIGYRLVDGHYAPIQPQSASQSNSQSGSRWESTACRLWLEVTADQQGFQLGDLRTGSPLPMPTQDDDPAISAQAEASRRAQSIAGQLKL